jgi:hypothetical protein
VPEPVQRLALHPGQFAHCLGAHWVSSVHQQGRPAAVQEPADESTSLQVPTRHDQAEADDFRSAQPTVSNVPIDVDPVHVPLH